MTLHKRILSLIGLLTGTQLTAQVEHTGVDIFVEPNFFIAIITGVILALGIQVLLTALSIATGISSVGDVRRSYINSHYDIDDRDQWDEPSVEPDPVVQDVSHPGLKLTTAFGVWSIITVGLSLFAASFFALKLALVTDPSVAMTLSLVIWASTLMILFYFESRLAKTLIGGLISVATTGLKASADALTGLFRNSPEKKISTVIDDTIMKIRSEFEGSVDTTELRDVIKAHTSAVKQNRPDMSQIREEIQTILAESEANLKESKRAMAKVEEFADRISENDTFSSNNEQQSRSAISSALSTAKWVAIQAIIKKGIDRFSQGNSLSDKLGARQLNDLLDDLEEAYTQGENREESARNVVHVLSPKDNKQTDEMIDQVLNYFKSTPWEKMDKEAVLARLNGAKETSEGIKENVRQRLNDLDKDTLRKTLLENTSLTEDQFEKALYKASILMDDIKANYAHISVNGPRRAKRKVDDVLRDFFDKVDRPELNYDALKSDIDRILDNPNDTLDVIKARATKLDSDTAWALLDTVVGVNRDDKQRVVDKIQEARQTVIDKVADIQYRANRKIENTKRQAVIRAENTRRIAAAAAWWLVATSILSALASIGGGLLSI